MGEAAVAIEQGSWGDNQRPLRIQYPPELLESIRAAVVDGFERLAHGGVEVGGVLFGSRSDGFITISAFRPLECEYARGPSFTLSENDELRLRRLLEDSRGDPDLSRLHALGWYHSHTRSEISLTRADVEIFNRYFPEPGQMAMVLRPSKAAPMRLGIFLREPGGSVRLEPSYPEIELNPVPVPRLVPREPARPRAAEPAALAVESKPPAPVHRPARRLEWKWLWALVAIALAGAALVGRVDRAVRPVQRVSLHATDSDGQLSIEWDRNAKPIREAESGSLEIFDGNMKVQIGFDADQLRKGSVTYLRKSDNLQLKLRVLRPGAEPIEEFTRFLGQPVVRPMPVLAPFSKPVLEARPAPIPAPAAAPPPPEPVRSVEAAPPRVWRPEKPAPSADATPLLPSALPTLIPHAKLEGTPVTPPAVQAQPPAQPAGYTGPRSGRLIWTGQLARNSTLNIEGKRSSTGYVTGELPGLPVLINVYPAELTDTGMTVFTSNTRNSNSRTEPPSASNGWNQTVYTWNPKRSGDVITLEPPSAQNGWKGLVLRSESPKVSVILLDWKLIEPEKN